MRHVERAETPPSLDGPASVGGMELAAATPYFNPAANAGAAKKVFEFKAYKGSDVRDALQAMFHNKCAYCEFFYAPGMPLDVEHYRPKAAYTDRGKQHKPGYWWLAMEWSNLLPSCIDCNRARAQEIVEVEGRMTAGKANQFPLARGSIRGTAANGVAKEKPLLLDPTVDDPAEYLEFLPNGGVRPKELDGKDSARGRATIDVVALQRRGLVDGRMLTVIATRAAIERVIETMKDIKDFGSMPGIPIKLREQRVADLRERLARNLRDLEAKAAPETQFSAVAEAIIADFKAKQGL
jgi:uncharacterized protein (TIGR02646 family)